MPTRPLPAPTSNIAGRLDIQYRPIDTLRLEPRNPRVHNYKQIGQIALSIGAFGFLIPILITPDGTLISGHGRVLACRKLGWTEVPTICVSHLSPAQIQAFRIADNRLTEIASWDDRLLAETLRDLAALDLEFSLEVTGFEMAEIDLRIEGLNEADTPTDDPADQCPVPIGPAISQLGDVWCLGRHRLLCGSALDDAAYRNLMQDDVAAMVFTDPPYNVPIQGHVSGLGAIQHREFAMATGEMCEAEFSTFLTHVLGFAARYSRDGSLHYVCMDWRHLSELQTAGRMVYAELKNLCVWVKDNAGMGSFYRSQHELVLVFKHGTAAHRNNIQLGRHGRNRSNVWHYPGVTSFRRTSDEGDLLALHPTVKPVKLVADAILDASARGEVVLDPFLGSGTTLIAAERVGRRCRGIELDPLYVDTIVRRWQALTGDVARHARTGQRFDDTAPQQETQPDSAATRRPSAGTEAVHGA